MLRSYMLKHGGQHTRHEGAVQRGCGALSLSAVDELVLSKDDAISCPPRVSHTRASTAYSDRAFATPHLRTRVPKEKRKCEQGKPPGFMKQDPLLYLQYEHTCSTLIAGSLSERSAHGAHDIQLSSLVLKGPIASFAE